MAQGNLTGKARDNIQAHGRNHMDARQACQIGEVTAPHPGKDQQQADKPDQPTALYPGDEQGLIVGIAGSEITDAHGVQSLSMSRVPSKP